MSIVEDFLTASEEQEIIEAIIAAEKNTSGEIRVHIENHTEKKPLERAQEVFFLLKMQNTTKRNGVLFYVGVQDHTFAIIGDQGINDIVEDKFWDKTRDLVISHFKKQNFKQGLVEGILKTGDKLKAFFPISDEDRNELSNEISKS
ncbi:MAG TPA: TPM domain-containing protein [Flavobacterium sp.]|nr:TPM domain-containing protein [Flavobacterium sp.]